MTFMHYDDFPYVEEQIEVIRRAAERGLKLAQETSPVMVDVMQHIVDECLRTQRYIES